MEFPRRLTKNKRTGGLLIEGHFRLMFFIPHKAKTRCKNCYNANVLNKEFLCLRRVFAWMGF